MPTVSRQGLLTTGEVNYGLVKYWDRVPMDQTLRLYKVSFFQFPSVFVLLLVEIHYFQILLRILVTLDICLYNNDMVSL